MGLINNTAVESLQSQAATTIFYTHASIAHWKRRSQFKYRSVVAASRCDQLQKGNRTLTLFNKYFNIIFGLIKSYFY